MKSFISGFGFALGSTGFHRMEQIFVAFNKILDVFCVILVADINVNIHVFLGIFNGQKVFKKLFDERGGLLKTFQQISILNTCGFPNIYRDKNSNHQFWNFDKVIKSHPVNVTGHALFPLVPGSANVISKVV